MISRIQYRFMSKPVTRLSISDGNCEKPRNRTRIRMPQMMVMIMTAVRADSTMPCLNCCQVMPCDIARQKMTKAPTAPDSVGVIQPV